MKVCWGFLQLIWRVEWSILTGWFHPVCTPQWFCVTSAAFSNKLKRLQNKAPAFKQIERGMLICKWKLYILKGNVFVWRAFVYRCAYRKQICTNIQFRKQAGFSHHLSLKAMYIEGRWHLWAFSVFPQLTEIRHCTSHPDNAVYEAHLKHSTVLLPKKFNSSFSKQVSKICNSSWTEWVFTFEIPPLGKSARTFVCLFVLTWSFWNLWCSNKGILSLMFFWIN